MKSVGRGNLRAIGLGVTATPEKLAYAAGFFDGEGCINISRWRQLCRETTEPGTYYKLRVMVSNNDLPSLQWFQAIWGGAINKKKIHGNRVQGYNWTLPQPASAWFLEEILPYLKQKRSQADVALEFFRSNERFGRNARPLDYVESRERFYQKLKQMKVTA